MDATLAAAGLARVHGSSLSQMSDAALQLPSVTRLSCCILSITLRFRSGKHHMRACSKLAGMSTLLSTRSQNCTLRGWSQLMQSGIPRKICDCPSIPTGMLRMSASVCHLVSASGDRLPLRVFAKSRRPQRHAEHI